MKTNRINPTEVLRRAPMILQAVSALLCPAMLVTSVPCSMLAAASNTSVARKTGSAPVPQSSWTPDAAVLAAQEAKLARLRTPQQAKPPRQPVRGKMPGAFGAVVADGELTLSTVLPVPLVVLGETFPEENLALAEIVKAYPSKPLLETRERLERYVKEWPDSAWRATVLGNLGQVALRLGYYGRAVEALKEGRALLAQAGERETFAVQKAAGIMNVHLSQAYAKMGSRQNLAKVVEELKNDYVPDSLRKIVDDAEKKAQAPEPAEGIGRSCGLQALAGLWWLGGRKGPMPGIYSDSELQKLAGIPLAEDGSMTLAQMTDLAKAARVRATPIKRTVITESWPVPSIVHWQWGHYSVITQRIEFPRFRGQAGRNHQRKDSDHATKNLHKRVPTGMRELAAQQRPRTQTGCGRTGHLVQRIARLAGQGAQQWARSAGRFAAGERP